MGGLRAGALVLLLAGCSSPTEAHESWEGEYMAEGHGLGLYLYDQVAGSQPEDFYVRIDGPPGSHSYWWGTYTESGDSLAFRLLRPNDAGSPNMKAVWVTRPTQIAATVAGYGAVRFRR